MDLVIAEATAIAAGLAALYHPTQVGLRTALAVPALLVVPGYLLLQAALPGDQRPEATSQLGLSVGLSLPIVGLVALATAATPWGFQRTPIVLAVMLASTILTVVAGYRRAGGLPRTTSWTSRQ